MKLLPIFAAVLVLSAPLLAVGDAAPALVNPSGSGLKVVRMSERTDEEVSFEGQIWVSGTLHAQWLVIAGKPLDSTAILKATLELDQSEMDRLPHFSDDKANEVWVENPKEAVQIAFDKNSAARFLGKKTRYAELHGRFLLKGLTIGECGSPWASATLVTASDQQKATFTQGWEFGDC